ncbi:alpha/beta hydrolase [Novosphingobium album (ex Hu et al. 2023)]|uniref:Alpha/beta hydrolase n=1 Tax=Novosphingobium album (ex Hu et al. 2023) TaxID=2930093 RepID=A0ABT0B028_9SPHN|nr:alpha/beta hydrolase [Novosphingobium album (ex Hu et al. 2023)]MCJ2178401.1 alpha/beta hydrolase [Novosphingobium album (ex Hu et al. 2023)]
MTSPPFPDDDVDPEIRDWLTQMFAASAALGSRPGMPWEELRAIAEKQREPWRTGGPAMFATEDLSIGDHAIHIRIHRPIEAEALPILVYLHGGGWTLFSTDTHDRLMREYAARAGIAVLGIDYRLAPEHRFPAGLDDVVMVLDWLRADGPSHGLDPACYALGGDSAGANLALAAAIRQRDAGLPGPAALLLNYGAFSRASYPSYDRYGDGDRYMLTGPEMDTFWDAYLGPEHTGDPLAEPLCADLKGLCPAWLCVAQCDVLLDENREMARLLAEAGISVDCHIYDGATHSFLEAVAISTLATKSIAESAEWLTEKLQ